MPGHVHKITLSNGRVLAIVEHPNLQSLAVADVDSSGNVATYVCSIDGNGVTVYPNSGDTSHWLSLNLQVPTPPAS